MPPTSRSRKFSQKTENCNFSPKSAPTCMKRNVGEFEIYLLSNFQLRTTLGDRQNVEKTKRKNFEKLQTLNVRLPPKQCSVWLQTLGNAFQTIPNISFFEVENIFRRRQKIFLDGPPPRHKEGNVAQELPRSSSCSTLPFANVAALMRFLCHVTF